MASSSGERQSCAPLPPHLPGRPDRDREAGIGCVTPGTSAGAAALSTEHIAELAGQQPHIEAAEWTARARGSERQTSWLQQDLGVVRDKIAHHRDL